MNHWKVIVVGAVISVLMLGSVSLLGLGQAKPYDGVVLHLACMSDQYANYLKVLGKQFESVSGAKVEVDILGYTELYQKITQDYATHTKQYDLATTDIVWTGEFEKKGWTVDLTPLILRDSEEINVSDILPIMWTEGSWQGKQIAFPLAGYANSLIYRKDLFNNPQEKAAFKKQYGYELRPPRTIDELRDAATFFTRPKDNLYGLTVNGARGPAVAQDWMEFMRAFGGRILDAKGNVTVDSPECLASLKFFVEIFDKWAPPGAVGYWWDDRETSYRSGQAVMEPTSWSIARAGYEDPSISRVVGKTGMAISPTIPAINPQFGFGGWGIAINADVTSEKQAAAWAFIKWIMSPEIQKDWMQHDGAPIRLSTLLDPDLNQKMPWLKTMLNLFIHGNGDYRPRVPEYSRIQDILGLRINQAITHELTPEEALEKASQEIKALYNK